MKRVVILISGRGSNMQALVQASLPATVSAVISNDPHAAGLAFAHERGLHTAVVDHRDYAEREAFDRALAAQIDLHAPDLVVLAGFMRILGDSFVLRYAGRLINIHPSLLPAFTGINTHRRALAEGVKLHGCTVHFVTAELDHGPIIAQAAVPVLPGRRRGQSGRPRARAGAPHPAAGGALVPGRTPHDRWQPRAGRRRGGRPAGHDLSGAGVKRFVGLLLAAAVVCSAWPAAAGKVPARIEIRYRMLFGSVSIGEGHDVFEHDGSTYKLISESSTAGIAAVIYRLDVTRTSTGSVSTKGLRPDTYDETRNGKAQAARALRLATEEGRAVRRQQHPDRRAAARTPGTWRALATASRSFPLQPRLSTCS